MDLGFNGAVAIVTGASQGLGKDISIALAREGARLVICARSADKLEAVAAQIRELGSECLPLAMDLTAEGAAETVVARALETFGSVSVLINNVSSSVDATPASIEAATDRQLLARIEGKTLVAIRFARAVLPAMKAQGWGRIVTLGGTAARTVFRPGDAPFAGSGLPQALGNASVVTFSKYLSDEVAADNIMVNVVHPHITRTDRHAGRVKWYAQTHSVSEEEAEKLIAAQFPVNRMIEPSDVLPIVLLLASPVSGAVTGQSIAVDGGALRNIVY